MNPIKLFTVGAGSLILIIVMLFCWNSVVRIDPHDIVVIQSLDGTLDVYSQPGWTTCWFGKATVYQRSFQCDFAGDGTIPIRFNDGGTGTVSASIRADLPLDAESMKALHKFYGSQEAVEKQLARTSVVKAVTLAGPMMSSTQSYASGRAELIGDIEDQAKLGIYQTTTTDAVTTDPITNEQKHITLVTIVKDDHGVAKRVEDSVAKKYGVNLYNFTLENKGIEYSNTVEQQIVAQQNATMQVQIGAATVKKADQDKLTAEAEGAANAATAKWAQETKNATVVAEQEGLAQAAAFTKQQAQLIKDATILKAEGEAQAKTLMTQSNNNLDQKLATYEAVNKYWADAFASTKSSLVPQIVMGGGASGTNSSATSSVDSVMQLVQARVASQLGGLDLSPSASNGAIQQK